MKLKELIIKVIFLVLLQFVINEISKAQDYSRLLDKADTVNFSNPKSDEWRILNSFVKINATNDSVLIEVIVMNDKQNISWKDDQYIGQITYLKFISKTDRVGWCYLINSAYKIRIESNGKCYFNLEKGVPPTGVPAVLPLKMIYKL
jgi:hypothetical protein